MSYDATSWAWKQSTRSSGERLVLLALANAAGGNEDDPRRCWPSIGRIAAQTQIGASTVRKHVESLCDAGLITKVERFRRHDGTLGTWVVNVNFDQCSPSSASQPVLTGASTSAHVCADQCSPGSAQETTEELTEESTRASDTKKEKKSYAVEFDGFWNWYPRKVGKPAAQRAFVAAAKRDGLDLIRDGFKRALDHWSAERTEQRFIPHPATWLNGARYLDEVTSAAGQVQTSRWPTPDTSEGEAGL